MIIRNDDVDCDTTLEEIKRFCEICDKYGVKILQAITPLGGSHKIDSSWDDYRIMEVSGKNRFIDNKEVYDYLRSRNDLIGVHGLWHTHKPSLGEVEAARELLKSWGFNPTYCVWPFNEASTDEPTFAGLQTSGQIQRIEDFLTFGTPDDEMVYLHSWRWPAGWYDWEDLDMALNRIINNPS